LLNQEDQVEEGLKIPNSVLEECEKSFIAADENRNKAAAGVLVDTGLMALICHHDHPIFMVNMNTTGEKQYYAIALLEALFSELPTWWRMGILYDIGCQLDHSMNKVSN